MKRARAYELLNKKEECLRGDVHCKGVGQGTLSHKLSAVSENNLCIPPPQKVFGNSKGRGVGMAKAKSFKDKYGA